MESDPQNINEPQQVENMVNQGKIVIIQTIHIKNLEKLIL